MSAQDKWRRQQQTTMHSRKQDGGERAAEVERERERDGKDISERNGLTSLVTSLLQLQ